MNFLGDDNSKYLNDPDVQLMLNFQRGDKKAFEALMTKYFSPLMNFIYKFVRDRETAEDLTQEVFMKVYKAVSSYSPRASFKTWLYKIAHNVSLNEVRRNKHKMFSIDAQVELREGNVSRQMEDKEASHPDEDLLNKEKVKAIKDAIWNLPKNQRIAVILKRYDNFSYEEIAKTMNLSEKAVKSLLSRAKENLKNDLKKYVKND